MHFFNRLIIPLIWLSAFLFPATHYGKQQKNLPVLLLSSPDNFGDYTAELLKAEGFHEFETVALNGKRITAGYLRQYDIVILTAALLTNEQQKAIADYVNSGGNLIAFKPAKALYAVFGITPVTGTIDYSYLVIDSTTQQGNGINTRPLKLHVEGDKFTAGSEKIIAAFFDHNKIETGDPAVVTNNYGKGHAIAFLYNLPQNIIYTRQGNYRDAGIEKDGINGIRAMDLFTGSWVDTTNNTLNPADEQMRLLTHCIEYLEQFAKPLPRLWYFPDTLKCLVTLTNDGEDSKESEFQQQFEEINARKAGMTLYIKEVDLISKKWVDTWSNLGFEMAGHPDDTRQAPNPDWITMDSVYKKLLYKLKKNYNIERMRTVTNHWFVWCGNNRDGKQNFAAQAIIEERNGIELDCNYAHYDNNSTEGHFLGSMGINQGNFTGSGLVMKFADISGRTIQVYQQLNNVYDQQYMEHKDPDGYFDSFRGLMDRSLDHQVYSFISIKAHNNEYFFSRQPLLKMMDYATAKKIPVWTELNLLGFLKARDSTGFTDFIWKNNVLKFQLKSFVRHNSQLSCMIPDVYAGKIITGVSVNEKNYPFHKEVIKGTSYVFLLLSPGSDYRISVTYR